MLKLRRRAIAARSTTPDPFDRRGYVRSPITYPGYRLGKEPPNKGRTFPPEVPTQDEYKRLLTAALAPGTAASLRNYALLVVGGRGGLRCDEALSLRPKDLDLEHGRITVLHGKGDKRRVVAFDRAACESVQRWLDVRARLGFTGAEPAFCVVVGPTAGAKINGPYVRALMVQLCEKAGIDKRVSFHTLRHFYASTLLDGGAPIHFIKQMLGHSSIAITEAYADHISPSRVIEFLRNDMSWADISSGLSPKLT